MRIRFARVVSVFSLFAGSLSAFPALEPVDRLKEGWWAKRWEHTLNVAKDGKAEVVFLGDSITQGWEGEGKAMWNQHWAPLQSANFGFSGDRTEHVLWRIDNGQFDGLDPRLVVIMIGTNNIGHGSSNAEQTAEGVEAIVGKLRTKFPQMKILLLGIFPRGATADDAKRKAVAEATVGFKGIADGNKVHFLDLAPVFLAEDGSLPKEIMPDLLHLSRKGYELWAGAMAPKVKELLGK